MPSRKAIFNNGTSKPKECEGTSHRSSSYHYHLLSTTGLQFSLDVCGRPVFKVSFSKCMVDNESSSAHRMLSHRLLCTYCRYLWTIIQLMSARILFNFTKQRVSWTLNSYMLPRVSPHANHLDSSRTNCDKRWLRIYV